MSNILVHKHLIIRAEIEKPPVDPKYITKEWLPKLIENIGMKILMGPYATYHDVVGNRGLTAVVVIETSHIALHVWDEDEVGLLQLDVYSCAPFDPYIVNLALVEFEPICVEMKYLDRENNLCELPLLTESELEEYELNKTGKTNDIR